ncbi:MAG TPA: TIGR02466 family protein [Verrucomicrobiae bacterium]|jgi:uncharacterized protein (TIGR02466 family)
MSVQAWFPTLIYRAPLLRARGARFNAELLKESYLIRDNDPAGQRWSKKNYPGGYTSYGSLDKLHKFSSTFMELERHLLRHANAYARALEWDLRDRELALTDCWVNIMPRGTAHGLHLHPLSVISGTYYVKTPRGCAGLKFEDPRLGKFMATPPRRADCAPEQRHHIAYPAVAGRVTLFESWLRHEVAANPVRGERLSISFNFAW